MAFVMELIVDIKYSGVKKASPANGHFPSSMFTLGHSRSVCFSLSYFVALKINGPVEMAGKATVNSF